MNNELLFLHQMGVLKIMCSERNFRSHGIPS